MEIADRTPLRHLVECPVCLERDGLPKVLSCLHTLCQGCIGSLPRGKGNTVKCPLCRKQVAIPRAGSANLPTNLTVVQLRDLIDPAHDQRKACQYCTNPTKQVSIVCKYCEEEFCTECANTHASKLFFKDHKLVPMAVVVCGDHNRPFILFCLDCNRLLCFLCHNQQICDGHQVIKVESLKTETEAAMKKLIKDISHNIEINKKYIQPARVALMEGLTSVQQQKNTIKEHCKILKDDIDCKVKYLLAQADEHENSLYKLKKQVEEDDHLVALYKLKETVEAAWDRGIEQALISLPSIQATLPPDSKPPSQQAFNKLIFAPQHSVDVGTLYKHGQTTLPIILLMVSVFILLFIHPLSMHPNRWCRQGELTSINQPFLIYEYFSNLVKPYNQDNMTPEVSMNIKTMHHHDDTLSSEASINLRTLDMKIDSVSVKQEQKILPQGPISASRHGDDMVHTPKLEFRQVWRKGHMGNVLWDVVLLDTGRIAFTDTEDKMVTLMDRQGQVFTDSTQKSVTLHAPHGIAYHQREHAYIVCDYGQGHVVFLHPTDLHQIKHVTLSGLTDPVGVSVLSDGSIVVSGNRQVGVFNVYGTQLHLWDSYNNGAGHFEDPGHVAVDQEDNILVSDYLTKKIIKLDKTGLFLYEWSTVGSPLGLTVVGETLLVAQAHPDTVTAYSLQGNKVRQVIGWHIQDEGDIFGDVMSLSTHDNELIVIGLNGLIMFKLNAM